MSRHENRKRKVEVKEVSAAVRAILNEWSPIPESPADEFDCVVDRVVSELYRGASVSDLQQLISHEFAEHIGLPAAQNDARLASERIMAWWRIR